MEELYITILAGGMGKRMQSDLPKVLHKVKGEAMIVRLLKQVSHLSPGKILIVVGKYHTIIQEEIDKHTNEIASHSKIVYVNQPLPLGTGDAVKCTLPHITNSCVNIILNGDVPLIRYQTIEEIYAYYKKSISKFVITSINLANPTGNGRIIQDANGTFKEIVEEKDCTAEQKLVKLVNCGIYICSGEIIQEYIPKISSTNAQSEYYLTDLVKIYLNASDDNAKVNLFILPPEKEIEIYNVNTKEQLQFVDSV